MNERENPKKNKQTYREYMRKVKREFIRTVRELLQDEFRVGIIVDDDNLYISLGYGFAFKMKVTSMEHKKQGELFL